MRSIFPSHEIQPQYLRPAKIICAALAIIAGAIAATVLQAML